MRKSTAAPLALAAALAFAAPASAQDSEPPALSVTGTGTVAAAPDIAHVTVGVETRDASAAAALRINSRSTRDVIEALGRVGVAREDIQTSEVSIRRQRGDPQEDNQTTQYVVTNAVRILTEVDRLGATLDAAVEAGADTVGGIAFRVGNAAALRETALRRAVKDARRKAEILAAEAGIALGAVVRVVEGRGVPSPRPLAAVSEARADVPIMGGTEEIAQSVTVTWRIAD